MSHTTLSQFTVTADGVVGELREGFQCHPGHAVIAMKAWAADADEAARMVCVLGAHTGFAVGDEREVYSTEPSAPAGAQPHGYDVAFTPYGDDDH